MKRVVLSATNSVSIPAKPEVVEAAENEEAMDALNDKISSAKADFDYIMDGLDQLDMVQANEIVNKIHETLSEYIQEIAGMIA